MADRKINTGLTEAQVHEAFSRALHDLTDAQVRALVSAETVGRQEGDEALGNAIVTLETSLLDEIDTRHAADEKHAAALGGLIDGGAKNRATVNNTSGTRNVVIPVSLPAGEYVIRFGEITSTDTEASVCRVALADASDTAVWSGGTTRGTDKSISVTIGQAAAMLYVYASDNYSHSSGKTVTVSDLMICTKADWDISQAYVPYCPTMPELYQMILAQNVRRGTEAADA